MENKEVVQAGESLLEAEHETHQDRPEEYGREPDFRVSFKLPRIIFKSIRPSKEADTLERLAIATVRRYFYLTEDWYLDFSSKRYPRLSGEIVIPQKVDGDLFKFDGASIPLPWLISLLTVGILRPLGVLLIASIVHDFAFRHGHLRVRQPGGTLIQVPVERHVADSLFRDIITTVNGNKVVGFLGWYFVRIGYWCGVKYHGSRCTGAPPYGVALSFLAIVACVIWMVAEFSFSKFVIYCLALYLAFYMLTLERLKRISTPAAMVCVVLILMTFMAAIKGIDRAAGPAVGAAAATQREAVVSDPR